MAPSTFPKIPLALVVALALAIQGALGEIVCEELPPDVCAFSISLSGKRCLLEKYVVGDGSTEYQCKSSEVVVGKMAEWIETDDCVKVCGVDRNMVGISSDSLLEPQFTGKLCSTACYQNCPNIVDLYFNLAAGEGVFLPELCEFQRSNPRRAMAELLSAGVAPGPISSAHFAASAAAPVAAPPMSI